MRAALKKKWPQAQASPSAPCTTLAALSLSLFVLQKLPHKWEPSQLPTTPGLLKGCFLYFPQLKNQYERIEPEEPLGLSVEKWEQGLKESKVEFLDTKIHIVKVNEV